MSDLRTRAPKDAVEAEDLGPIVEVERRYRRRTVVRLTALGAATLVLVSVAVVAAGLGPAKISPGEVLRALVGRATGNLAAGDERNATIVLQLRLPRIVMAIVAGSSLAVAGVVMQGLLRNPLVSPFTLGISSAAAFGASVAIVFGASAAGSGALAIVGSALVAALGCAAIVFSLSWLRQMSALTVILVGVALTYLFSALTATLQLLATDDQIAAIVRWTFGSFNGATWREVTVLSVVLALVLPLVLLRAGSLNAVAFGGDEVAKTLGVNIARLRLSCGVLSVVLAAVVVSFTGVIGFVGLVAPHIARLIIGGDHRFLLPFSAMCGALLLLVADTVGRTLFSPTVIPVGIVVSYLGVPLFLNLILSRRRQYF